MKNLTSKFHLTPQFDTFHIEADIQLECGKQLSNVDVAYTTYGELNQARDNVVWICHPLTCDADPTHWWPDLVAPDAVLSPQTYFIVCANVVGSCYGSTGPSHPGANNPGGQDFPLITLQDIVGIHEQLRMHLGIDQIYFGIGASFGGQQLIQWMSLQPDLFLNACIAGANARQSPWAIAFNETQRMALEADPNFHNNSLFGGSKGLAAARALAVISYRNFDTYLRTQHDDEHAYEGFRAASYQRYIGNKFTQRFTAPSYWCLTKAMDSHDIARGKASMLSQLQAIQTRTLLLTMADDVLFQAEESYVMANAMPFAEVISIPSTHGHDGLLANSDLISVSLANFLHHQ